jgi:HEAT repeat protein
VARDACTTCHTGARGAPGGVPPLSPERIRSAYREWWPDAAARPGVALPIVKGRTGAPDAVEALSKLALDPEASWFYRASAARLLGRYPDRALEAIARLMRSEDARVRAAAAGSLVGIRGEAADSILLGALQDESPAVRARAARAALSGWWRVRANRRLLEGVIDALAGQVVADPADDRDWFRLGAAHQIAGDAAKAIDAYEKKLLLDPYARYVRETVEKLRREVTAEGDGGK